MKRIIACLLCLSLLFSGCTTLPTVGQKQYTATFLTLFDTVTTIVGRADSEAAFQDITQPIHDELERYHRLFDIYQEYDGINNLKTVNDNAAVAPVTVDTAILDLLQDCKTYYAATSGAFNPALGSVLSLWHTAREDGIDNPAEAYLPSSDALTAAAQHCNPDDIILDRDNSTVFFRDASLRLDVGAIAKGWAVQRVCESAPSGLLISVGGNVCATGPKAEDGAAWAVGVRHPRNESEYLHILNVTEGCVVTSGDYQRSYTVDGKQYHHIIDPTTLYPSTYWTSVTVTSADSGLADVLSTSLFVLNREDGQALLDRYAAQAMWVDLQGNILYSPDFEALIRN